MIGIRDYIYGGLILLLLTGGAGFWIHHDHKEQAIGEQKVVAAQKAADAKEAIHVQQVQDDATATIQDLQLRYAAVLASPPVPRVVVRMCDATPGVPADAPRSDAGTESVSDAAGGSSGGVGGADQAAPDIAPATEVILNRDKAIIAYLQGYIRECQKIGNCAEDVQDASP
jgi:hypothetical protein